MLGAKRGFGQSTDCAAQSMDLCFARRSTDCLLNPWIAYIEGRKAWIWPNHGFKLEDIVYYCYWINGATAACMALLLCTHAHGKDIINVVQ